MRKIIAIVDTLWVGHHPTYFKLFCTIAIDCGYKVIALSPNFSEMTKWKNSNKYSFDQIEIFTCNETPPIKFSIQFIGSLLTTSKRWLNVKSTLNDIKPDLVFFTWLDNYLSVLLCPFIHKLIFPFAWSGIYFHPIYLRTKSVNRLQQKVRESATTLFKSNKCKGVAVLDEGISAALQNLIGDKPVTVFPDVANDSTPDLDYYLIKKINAKAKNKKIVLLAGALAKRKGFFTLLDTALNFPTEKILFVFAGILIRSSFTKEELELIDRFASAPPMNCFFFFKKIPNEAKFNGLIAISDVLFACYNNFLHSSNMLIKAALHKKPIITSNRFCMGERVRKFGLGVTINEGSFKECIKAIKELTNDTNMIDDLCYEQYRSVHSIEKLKSKFSALLS